MVSRETSIAEALTRLGVPEHLREPALDRLTKLGELLRAEAVPKGYLGPHEEERVTARHVIDSLRVLPLIGGGHLVDVGSGAGLPGIPLACVREDPVTLIEAQARRAQFLREVVHELRFHNVTILNSRAESVGRSELRDSADVVVARALAAPSVALELTVPLARVGGRVLIMIAPGKPDPDRGDPDDDGDPDGGSAAKTDPKRPPRRVRRLETGPEPASGRASEEDGAAGAASPGSISVSLSSVSESLGAGHPEVVKLGVPGSGGSGWVMMVQKIRPTPERFPRRPGVPQRRPLG